MSTQIASNPIRFYLKERVLVDPRNPQDTSKRRNVFQAQVASRGRVKFRDFCSRVARGASFTQQEVEAVINYATEIAREIVANGSIVEFGDLGTLSPSFVGKVAVKAEEFSVITHIARPKVCFRASRDYFDLRTYPGVSFQRITAPVRKAKAKKPASPKPQAPTESQPTTPAPSSGSDGHLGI